MRRIRKDPNAPAVVARHENVLRGLEVDEISSVEDGANQLADVILIKGRIEKTIDVLLDEAASAGPAHPHGAAELPDGTIAAGTYRFGPGGAEDHDHTVEVTAAIEPGQTVDLISSVGGPVPHQHDVSITARERIMQSRWVRLKASIAKAVADGTLDMAGIEEIIDKDEHTPNTFEEERGSRLVDFLDGALDERARTLMMTTFGILFSEETDKERLILEAVDAFALTMHDEVPKLFSGELAKGLTEFLSADTPPTLIDVRNRVEKLLPSGGDGGVMFEFKGATKEGKAALEKAWDAAGEDGKKIIEDVWKASQTDATSTEDLDKSNAKILVLESDNERLTKALTGESTEPDVHHLLKGKTAEEAALMQPMIAHYDAELKKSKDATAKLQESIEKDAEERRDEKFLTLAKSYKHLATPHDEMVKMLKAADDAGTLDTVVKTLEAASKMASGGSGELGELGFESIEKSGDRQTAHAAIEAKAVELRKGRESEITAEQAYVEAVAEMPGEAALATTH